ncbi:MAG: B12-binding domain-containing radical SAM protein [Deltaproteobacteria bacterium]|nr:B12-binding domain-containing radical SAM protein [Deltaproteobacteria bacterium]
MNLLFLTSAAPPKAGVYTCEKLPPLGLASLMAVLKRAGHRVWFSDQYLKPSNILDGDFLERHDIEVVGIYANTVCLQSTLAMLATLQRRRERGQWSGRIMVGGPHTAVGQEELPDYVDHIVIGEGEVTVPRLLEGADQQRVVQGEAVADLDTLPMPAWEELIHLPYQWTHQWHPRHPTYCLNTSRGCPFDCTFCSVKAVWGKTYRAMSAERVVSDVEHMIRHYGAKAIYFREDHFTLSKNRTIDFCELLLKRGIDIDWLCETRVDQLDDPAYVKLMADAGCKVFYIGVESGSPRMLERYQKNETPEQFVKAFDIARQAGIKTYASLIVGFPDETAEDEALTRRLLERIRPDFTGFNVFLGLPGSELYDEIRARGLYEYEDENHILYPVGFKDNARRYYGADPTFDLYRLPLSHRLRPRRLRRRLARAVEERARRWGLERLLSRPRGGTG